VIQRISEVLNVSIDYLVDDKLDLPEWVAPLKVQIDSKKSDGAECFTKPELRKIKGHIDVIAKALGGVSKIIESSLKK